MLLQMAWRNLMRNRRRTGLTLSALVLGVCAIVFGHSFNEATWSKVIRQVTESQVGHLQVHGAGWQAEPELGNVVADPAQVEARVTSALPGARLAQRVLGYGLAGTEKQSAAVVVMGIQPEREPSGEGPLSMVRGRALSSERSGEVVLGRALAVGLGLVDFTRVVEAKWLAVPRFVFPSFSPRGLSAAVLMAPIAVVLVTEHIGHLLVTNKIVERDFTKDPGLHRSLLGDGLACTFASLVGGPPATTYGENIGVMAITRVFSVWVLGGAAVIAILLSFVQKLGALIQTIPTAVMGGVSIALFGVIAAAGTRLFVEAKVDFGEKRNLILASVIMVLGVGGSRLHLGSFELDGMTLATAAGILLNLVLPRPAQSQAEEGEQGSQPEAAAE